MFYRPSEARGEEKEEWNQEVRDRDEDEEGQTWSRTAGKTGQRKFTGTREFTAIWVQRVPNEFN